MHASHDGGSARSFVFLWEHTCCRRHRLLPEGQALFYRYCDDSIHGPGHALWQPLASALTSAPFVTPTPTTTHHRRPPSPSRQLPSSLGRHQYRPWPRRCRHCRSCRHPTGPSRTSCSSSYVHSRGHQRSITNQWGEPLIRFGGILQFARLILHFWPLEAGQKNFICNFIYQPIFLWCILEIKNWDMKKLLFQSLINRLIIPTSLYYCINK